MGLDIHLYTDLNDEVWGNDYFDEDKGYFALHSLSRTFCNFMCRRHADCEEPELDQIGRITNTDISPLYQMETYQEDNDAGLQFYLEVAESEEERQGLLDEARQNRESMKGNIDRIHSLIGSLIDQLSTIDNLHKLLDNSGYDTLRYDDYFTDFNMDKGDGYIGNNFGQDLRNFKRFLEFAKEKGAQTVYFNYG